MCYFTTILFIRDPNTLLITSRQTEPTVDACTLMTFMDMQRRQFDAHLEFQRQQAEDQRQLIRQQAEDQRNEREFQRQQLSLIREEQRASQQTLLTLLQHSGRPRVPRPTLPSSCPSATSPGPIIQWMIENTTRAEKGKFHLSELYARFSASRPNTPRDDAAVRKELFTEGGRYLLELGLIYKRAVNVNGVTKAGIRGRKFNVD